MYYEVWDSGTGNRIASYGSRREALLDLSVDVEKYGADSDAIKSLVLIPHPTAGIDKDEPPLEAPGLATAAINERDLWIPGSQRVGAVDRSWYRYSTHSMYWRLTHSTAPRMWCIQASIPNGTTFRAWNDAMPVEALALAKHWADLTIKAWLEVYEALL